MKLRVFFALVGAVLQSLAACSGDGDSADGSTNDVPGEAIPDNGPEAIPDAADAGPDPAPDTSTDVRNDAPADTPAEVVLDVPADAPPEVAYPDLNGCSKATAQDETGKPSVTITFGGDFAYTPACLVVSAGTRLVFEGNFSFHPLAGGLAGTVDASSPFAETTSGTSAEFTLTEPGAYGFFCKEHSSTYGMQGAAYVD